MSLRSFTTPGLLMVAGFILSGCSAVALSVVEGSVSKYVGRDCSTVRLFKEGSLCEAPPVPEDPGPPLYCYRELGATTCYDRPDPYMIGSKEPEGIATGSD